MRILLLSLVLTLSPLVAQAVESVEFALNLSQFDSTSRADVPLFTDTVTIVKGIPATGFVVALSSEIRVTEIDTGTVTFDVHLVTLGPPPTTRTKNFIVEYGLPATVPDITGKAGARYTFQMTPLRQIDVDTAACGLNHRQSGVFSITPTAHTDMYYVPNSAGDYYFDSIKDLFETEYRIFKDLYKLTLPGKYNVFLCPCPLYSVLWDTRFGMTVDPTRNTAYVLVGSGVNTADPFALLQLSALRNLGYAPPFLSEGLAGYLSFAIYDMKKMLDSNRVVPVEQLLGTRGFYQADPVTADRTAATFTRYLIDRYSVTKFQQLWKVANDIHLPQQLEQVYGKTVAELEAEWRTYVDTVTLPAAQFQLFAERAEQMRNYGLMCEYAREHLDHAITDTDTLNSLYLLKRSNFFTGNYYKATEYMDRIIKREPEKARHWMERAAYKMMNGYYDDAREDLLHAQALDTTDRMIRFNLAMNRLFSGQPDEAAELLFDLVTEPASSVSREARIYLAGLLQQSGDENDRALAVTYLQEALSMYEQELRIRKASPTAYLWSGIAYLQLADTDMATNLLSVASFLEQRPFYVGMINLWLGKAADVLGDRSAARDFYGRVLANESADYHQKEARRYLEEPYHR